jgi:hypothetical protein
MWSAPHIVLARMLMRALNIVRSLPLPVATSGPVEVLGLRKSASVNSIMVTFDVILVQ